MLIIIISIILLILLCLIIYIIWFSKSINQHEPKVLDIDRFSNSSCKSDILPFTDKLIDKWNYFIKQDCDKQDIDMINGIPSYHNAWDTKNKTIIQLH